MVGLGPTIHVFLRVGISSTISDHLPSAITLDECLVVDVAHVKVVVPFATKSLSLSATSLVAPGAGPAGLEQTDSLRPYWATAALAHQLLRSAQRGFRIIAIAVD